MRILAITLLIVLWATPAFAQTLAERQELRDWSERIASNDGALFERHCGYEMPFSLDPALAAPFIEAHASAGGYCGAVINSMWHMCRNDETARESVAARVRSVECIFDEEATQGVATLSDEGKLTFRFNTETSNIGPKIGAFLGEELRPDGLNLEQRQAMNGWQEQIQREVANSFVRRCGYELNVTLDDAFAAPFMENHTSAGGYCLGAVSAIRGMCEDEMAREAITSSVTTLECHYDPDARTGAFELREDGTFRFSFGLNTSNIGSIVREFLGQAL